MLTEQLLDRLAAKLCAHGVPVEEALAPGTDVSSFTSDDGSLHVELPAELRTWWAWHDGRVERWDGPRPLGPALRPMSATQSRDWWQRSIAMAQDAAADAPEGSPQTDPDYWWRLSWVPLFSDGTGYLVGDCDLSDAGVAPIRRIKWEPDLDVTARPRTDSFGQLVEWWIEALDLGLWSFDRDTQRWTSAPWDRALSDRYQGLIV
jgi:cell wall assembly regulator SMI1